MDNNVMELIDTETVQSFLDNIGGHPFTVTFLKKDGSERSLTGMLDPNGKRSENVPVMEMSSGKWKSFNINRVVSIVAN